MNYKSQDRLYWKMRQRRKRLKDKMLALLQAHCLPEKTITDDTVWHTDHFANTLNKNQYN